MANGKTSNWLVQVGTLAVGIAAGSVLTTLITRTNIVDQLLSPARSIWMDRTDDPTKQKAQERIQENVESKKGFSSEELIAKGVDDLVRMPNSSYRI
jgi:hypothetical protein